MIDERHFQHANKQTKSRQTKARFFSFIEKGKQKHRKKKNERKKEDAVVNTIETVKTGSWRFLHVILELFYV